MRMVNYPAILHCEEKDSCWITFPDFDNVFSQGKNMDDSIKMSIDALTLELAQREQNGKEFPDPTITEELSISKDEKLVYIVFDYDEQKKTINNFKSVKKTLTIPQWLNDEAMKAGLNFSAILQKGLKAELGIRK